MRAVKAYPPVIGEQETLQRVLDGASIARFGDGEFNHVRGRKNVSQVVDKRLTEELQAVLVSAPKSCLVGIPTMNPVGPKYANWSVYKDTYAQYLNPKRRYYSAFITRPDSAPWIDQSVFYDAVESLWAGKRVTLVGNGKRSITREFLLGTKAAEVDFVQCPYRDAYAEIDALERRCIEVGRSRVILCAGPTATCLAVRLARHGFHAVDLGHIGMFWRRYANPKKKGKN